MAENCLVCGHPVKSKDAVQVGSASVRHKDCKPGSPNWMATKGKTSDIAKYFRPEGETAPAKPQKHPQHKNVKAFAGRVKYLWFMHQRDRKDPEYHGCHTIVQQHTIGAEAEFLWNEVIITVKFTAVPLEPQDTLIKRIEDLL